jgi:signal peptidase I
VSNPNVKKAMPIFFKKKNYSLRKCARILKEGILRYKKLLKALSKDALDELEKALDRLEQAIASKDTLNATDEAKKVELFLKTSGKKSTSEQTVEFFVAIILAIVVAAFVRQMWFELYEIPSGSMRPTFKEQDRVLVEKNAFGINTPFQTSHLEFDPNLIKRGSIIVFSGDGIDLPDVDTTYFIIFPGKKRYVKRCMGKPGDTVYFYGGRMYGIDKDGSELQDLIAPSSFSDIEHIPFLYFEGRKSQRYNKDTSSIEIILKQMNIPLGRIIMSPLGGVHSEIFTGSSWQPVKNDPNPNHPEAYSQFWGMKNYAIARLINPKDLPQIAIDAGYKDDSAKLYLELKHTPSLPQNNLKPAQVVNGGIDPLYTRLTWIPINTEHLQKIKDALYTSRFVVQNGRAYHYTDDGEHTRGQGVFLSDQIPNGTYEFFSGKAYEIGLGSIAHELKPSHPIYPHTLPLLKALFNSGIELSEYTNSTSKNSNKNSPTFFPARYAYFRDGDLLVMGGKFASFDDPLLQKFNQQEEKREKEKANYIAFKDNGAPLLNGKLNKEFIQNFGLKIPEGHYLALGDNHANSADSRYFGFVPEDNLQGSPAEILWPVSPRLGPPPQPSIPFFRIENFYVLIVVGIIGGLSYWFFTRSGTKRAYIRMKQKRHTP